MTGMLEEEGAISDELVCRVRSLTRRIKEMEEEHKEKERFWENKNAELRQEWHGEREQLQKRMNELERVVQTGEEQNRLLRTEN